MNTLWRILFLLLLAVPARTIAQVPDIEFGKVDPAQLRMTSCPFEKEANAMVLYDYESVTCKLEGYMPRIITERFVRIKIFNQNGFSAANIQIPYLNRGRHTKMKEISAICYNLDSTGKIVAQKIEKKQIFKNKSDDEIRSISFSFPGLKPGSVVEYKYTKIENDNIVIEPWDFQQLIPVAKAHYNITLPGTSILKYRIRSLFPVSRTDRDSVSRYNSKLSEKTLYLATTNIPSFRTEPFMSSIKDNIPRVEFSVKGNFFFLGLISDEGQWRVINSELYRYNYFGRQFKIDIPNAKFLVDSASKMSTTEEKIGCIFRYLQKNFTWDKTSTFLTEGVVETWDKKGGSRGDLNILLLNLLRKSGVYCLPVLVSTRDHGKPDKEFISLSQFNGVDIWVNDSSFSYLLDVTARHISFKIPPYNILNRNAFIVDTLGGTWAYIQDFRPLMKQYISALVSFDSAYNLKGEASVISYDYAKEESLRKAETGEEDDEEKDARNRKLTELSTSDYSVSDADDPLKPLLEKFNFEYQVTHTNDLYYFSPIFLTSLRHNPFTAATRLTDIDMGCNQTFIFTISLNLPEEMAYESLPPSILLRNSDTTITFRRVSVIEGKKAFMKITLEFNYSLIPKDEYEGIKEFYKKLFALLEEQIVLRKIK